MIYLDNNATTRPEPQVVEAVTRALSEQWQNPSSIHRPGQAARRQVELARKAVAELIGARPRDVVFTGSGTESVDLAIRSCVQMTGRPAIVTTSIEHNAIRELCESLHCDCRTEIRHAKLKPDGRVDLDRLADQVDDRVALVSIQWANNETGVIQPVEAIGRLCRERNVLFHCDGTQWVGKAPTDVRRDPVDLLTFSAHKFHGPKGVGALYVRSGIRLSTVIHGEQELGRRGGTENTPGICGMGAAAELARQWLRDPDNVRRAAAVRDRFETRVRALVRGVVFHAPDDASLRLWNTSNIAFPGVEGEALMFLLSERGVCASAGSACSSGSLQPSKVLIAMGISPEDAASSLRFSICRHTTAEEVERAATIIGECVALLRGAAVAATR